MSEIVCDSCGSQRNKLHLVQSKIMNNMSFSLCSQCKEAEKEPRWLIVLSARSGKDVSYWVNNKLYEGDDINPDVIPNHYFPHLN